MAADTASDRHHEEGGALWTLKRAATHCVDSRRTVFPISTIALLLLLLLFLVCHSHETFHLLRIIGSLRVLTTRPGDTRLQHIAEVAIEHAKQFLAVEAAAALAAFTVSSALTVAVVNVVATAEAGQEPTLAAVVERLGQSWKRTAITELTTTMLRFCYSGLVLVLLYVVANTSSGSLPLLLGTATICLLAAAHVEVTLHMASTISILEKEHCGFSALARAAELLDGGRWEAFWLSLLLLPAGVVVFAGLYVVKGEGLRFGAAETCAAVALATVISGAWAVVYRECVERKGEKSRCININLP